MSRELTGPRVESRRQSRGARVAAPLDWAAVHEKLKLRIEAAGVRVESRSLGPQTTGIFDGTSITTNSDCDLETRCHNLGHAFGHIVQWSLDGPRFQALYEALGVAKECKDDDPAGLERALDAFREYEEEASEYAAGLYESTGNAVALESFAPFARADIEAIVSYHRDGIAPIWSEFFAEWRLRAARGEIEVRAFAPKPIPRFTPHQIAPQEVIRAVRAESAASLSSPAQ